MHENSWLLETRRNADLDVHMSDATMPMWVAGGNIPSENCGNDQRVITYSVVRLLFVSFQILRFYCVLYCVPPPQTGSRKRGLAEDMPLFNIVRSITNFGLLYAYLGTCSGCTTAQRSWYVSLLGSHHKNWRSMHHTSSTPWPQHTTQTTHTYPLLRPD